MRIDKRRSFLIGQPWNETSPEESDELKNNGETTFRGRASTDSTIFSRPKRWQHTPPGSVVAHPARADRRMSISMRGSNASY